MSEPKAAPSGGKKKNQKKVTLSLQEFNKTIPEHDPQSQWGDIAISEEEEFESNKEHSSSSSSSSDSFRQNNRREPGGYRDNNQNRDNYRDRDQGRDNRDRDSNRPRENRERKPQNEIPNNPPYVAYVGNLSYSVTKDDLYSFFSENCKVEDVRLIVDVNSPDKRSKGYGYITFKNREDLETALTANDYNLGGRPIRVDVSTPRDNAQTSQYNRNDRNSDRNNDRNNDRGFKTDNRFEPSRADNADVWERGRVVVKSESITPPRKEFSKDDRRDNRDRDNRDNRDNNRRNNRDFNRRDNRDNNDNNNEEKKEEVKERTPLKLQPKSADASEQQSNEASKPKSNPFGEAKPRDEKLFEEKRQKEIAERSPKQDEQPTEGDKPTADSKDDSKERTKSNDSKYRPPRSNSGKPYNNNNNRYNNNNNRNNQKKKGGPRNEVQADSDGFVPTSKSAATPQSSQSTPAPASGPSIKNKFSALSNE